MAAPITATGVAAADLRAPSAQIARVKAERQARARAEKKIADALVERGLSREDAEKAALSARLADERFGSDGSVEVKLIYENK
jgi:hypothetical protein